MIGNFWHIIKTTSELIFNQWLFFIVVVVLIIFGILVELLRGHKPPRYQYNLKDSVMTSSELKFFKILLTVLENRYDVFPQIHLDAIMYYQIRGQNWTGAFRHINQKSIDFLLCDKNSGKPVLAIELDDRSHKQENRMIRDEEVERIFREVGLPLLRIKDEHTFEHSYTPEGISTQIFNILNK